MAILAARILERPSIVGRKTALAVPGNGKLARVANLTGREAYNSVRDVLLRISVRIQTGLEDAFKLSQLNPAYTCTGGGMGMQENLSGLTPEQEVEDFNRFIKLFEIPSTDLLLLIVSAGSIAINLLGFQLSGKWNRNGILVGLPGVILGGYGVLRRKAPLKEFSEFLARRYQTRQIPDIFAAINPIAAKKLEEAVREAGCHIAPFD